MGKEEQYHIQRAKKNWALTGDRNTSFFHHAIIKRNRKNRISHLINPDGSHSTTPQQLADSFITYFTNIFSSHKNSQQPTDHTHSNIFNNNCASSLHLHSRPHDCATNFLMINRSLQEEEAVNNNDTFRYTYSTPTLNEVYDIIKQMWSNAAPGPDGLNAAFYKST